MAVISRLMSQSIALFKNGYKGQTVRYVTKTLPSGTNVKVINEGRQLKKIVTKADGNQIVSKFTPDGKDVLSISEKSKRGTINHLFGGENYDKTVEVRTHDGGMFTFLGHKDRANGLLYSNAGGRYDANNTYIPQFKNAIDYIRGKISPLDYILNKLGK